MVMTDPIADLLTRIKNTNAVRHEIVEIPSSSMEKAVASILLQKEYIEELEEYNGGVIPMLRVSLKYGADKERAITSIERISKPGLKVYCRRDEIPKMLSGLGIAIISTSTNLLVDREARKTELGGKVVRYIW